MVVAFLSSAFTGAIGIGGGLLLLAAMTAVLPTPAIVPIHGVVQLASNASRASFALKHVRRQIVFPFALGCAAAATFGGRVAVSIPTTALAVVLGAFILILVWVPRRWFPTTLPGGYFGAGLVQTFLSLFVGATGPLNAGILAREALPRDQTVVTHAGMMTAVHLAKVVSFASAGFAFANYGWLLLALVVAATAGSYLGTFLRGKLPERRFLLIFRLALTALAIRLVLSAVAG